MTTFNHTLTRDTTMKTTSIITRALFLLLAAAMLHSTANAADVRNWTGGQRIAPLHGRPGKVVIYDFRSDWCHYSRQMDAILDDLASNCDDLILVKIDIVDWKS